MRKIYYFFAFVTLLFSINNPLHGQQIHGQVISPDNIPLEFVTVRVFKDTALIMYALSDKTGAYTFSGLPAKINYRLAFSYTGFGSRDTTLLLDKDIWLTTILQKQGGTLKEVVVKNRVPLVERKFDRLVFNVQNSMAALSGDAMDALKVTPMVSVQNDAISIIGKGTVSVMVNDRMLRISGEDLVNYIRSIPSNNIESIEVITMPSSRYSAEGNAGIINIKLKKPVHDQWSALVRSVYTQGTYPTGNLGINFTLQKKKFSLTSSANGTLGSNAAVERPQLFYATQTWNSGSDRRDYAQSFNGRVLADYKVNDKLILGTQLFYNQSRPHAIDKSTTRINNNVSGVVDSSLLGGGSQYIQSNNYSLNLNGTYKLNKAGGKVVLDIDYYKSNRDNDRVFSSNSFNADSHPIEGREWFSQNIGDNSFRNFAVNLDIQHKIKSFEVVYGLNYSSSDNRNGMNAKAVAHVTDTLFNYYDRFQFSENTGSLFFTISRKVSEKVELEAGVRGENTNTEGVSNTLGSKYTNNYFQLFPTFYAGYTLNDNNAFSFSYGRRIERPTYLSLNPFERYINQYYYSVGNPFLLPSFSHNLELNYSNNNNLNLSLFSSIVRNQVSQTAIPHEQSKLVVDTMQNFTNTVSLGLTVTYTLKKTSWLESNFVATGYYRNITQKDPAIAPDYEIWTGYLSTDNIIRLSKAVSSQVSFYYYTPQVIGIFKREAKYNLNITFRYKINSKIETALLINDLLKTSQGVLHADVNGIRQYYDNYYDSRYARFTLSYKFGNLKISAKQRNFSNEQEKSRAY